MKNGDYTIAFFIIFIIILYRINYYYYYSTNTPPMIFYFLFNIIEHHYYLLPIYYYYYYIYSIYDDICLGFLSSLRSSVLSPWLNMSDKFPASIAFDHEGRRRRGLLKGAGVEPRRVAIGLSWRWIYLQRSRAHSGLGTPETRRN